MPHEQFLNWATAAHCSRFWRQRTRIYCTIAAGRCATTRRLFALWAAGVPDRARVLLAQTTRWIGRVPLAHQTLAVYGMRSNEFDAAELSAALPAVPAAGDRGGAGAAVRGAGQLGGNPGDLAVSGYPALRTMQRWCASFQEQSARWLKAVQEWLAQQDSRSGWLDAQGEALQAGCPEQALLTASEHLLAWGKSQRVEMAEYGLEKRLSFLWLWGANQRVGAAGVGQGLHPHSLANGQGERAGISSGQYQFDERNPENVPEKNRQKPDAETRKPGNCTLSLRADLQPAVRRASGGCRGKSAGKEIAARSYRIPYSSRTKVGISTLRRYLKLYQAAWLRCTAAAALAPTGAHRGPFRRQCCKRRLHCEKSSPHAPRR